MHLSMAEHPQLLPQVELLLTQSLNLARSPFERLDMSLAKPWTVTQSSIVVVEPALGWPRYELFPGCLVAAVGGRTVVVVCGVRKEHQHYHVGKLMSEVEMTWHNFTDRLSKKKKTRTSVKQSIMNRLT